jgi:hypothetical protein
MERVQSMAFADTPFGVAALGGWMSMCCNLLGLSDTSLHEITDDQTKERTCGILTFTTPSFSFRRRRPGMLYLGGPMSELIILAKRSGAL